MEIKFNGGKGALLCDKCKVILMEGVVKRDWEVLDILNALKVDIICKECKENK